MFRYSRESDSPRASTCSTCPPSEDLLVLHILLPPALHTRARACAHYTPAYTKWTAITTYTRLSLVFTSTEKLALQRNPPSLSPFVPFIFSARSCHLYFPYFTYLLSTYYLIRLPACYLARSLTRQVYGFQKLQLIEALKLKVGINISLIDYIMARCYEVDWTQQ